MSIIGNNNISQKYPDFVVNTFTKKIANLSDLDDIVEARRNLGVAGNDTLLDIKDRIYNNADLNQYTTTGIYYQLSNTDANTGKNYPTPHAGYLEVISISSTFVYQYYKKYQSNEYYIRTKYNGVWSEWERLLKDSDISVINAELDDKISYEHDNTRPINEISVNNQISIRTTDNFNSYLKFVDSVFDENVMLYGDSGKNFHIRTGGEQGFTYNFPVNGIPDSDNDVVTNKFLEDSKDFSTNRDNHTGT